MSRLIRARVPLLQAPRWRRCCAAAALALVTAATAAACDAGGQPAYRPWKEQAPVIPAVPAGTGNGVATLGAADIVHAALTATGTAPSVHVKGSVTSDGATTAIDMHYDQTGGSGTVTAEGTAVTITRIQSDVWLAGNRDFWSDAGAEDDGAAFAGKYIKLSATDTRVAALTDLTRLSSLLDRLTRSSGPYATGPTSTISGVPAIAVLDQTPGYGGRIWVATEGQPYILRIDAGTGSQVRGTVTLDDYGAHDLLAAPDPANVLSPALVAQDFPADLGDRFPHRSPTTPSPSTTPTPPVSPPSPGVPTPSATPPVPTGPPTGSAAPTPTPTPTSTGPGHGHRPGTSG